MSSPSFAFISDNLPRIKAKQLSNAFPYLKLSAAQEATAHALGYDSWYQCIHRDKSLPPSASDQDAGLLTRIARYAQQANVLMNLKVPPGVADRWVRAWGLTGAPTLAPMHAVPIYYTWENALDSVDRGEISAERMIFDFGGDAEISKYPDVDQPKRICHGVILGPMGKYPHFAVDHQINARIPAYLRLPNALYHLEDDSDILFACVPGYNESLVGEEAFRQLNLVHHEWHFGTLHPNSTRSLVQALISSALSRPDAMVVISQRAMPCGYGKFEANRFALACLRGSDFAEFLRQKGSLNIADVVWYSNVDCTNARLSTTCNYLMVGGFENYGDCLPVFDDAHRYQPCLPLYSYPFKEAPMSEYEYDSTMERCPLLPLAQDYPDDDDDDDADDDGDAPLMPVTPQDIFDYEHA